MLRCVMRGKALQQKETVPEIIYVKCFNVYLVSCLGPSTILNKVQLGHHRIRQNTKM